MEQVYEELANARKYIVLADHLLTQTMPSVGEPKLLLVVIENIFLSFSHSVKAMLEYEKESCNLEFSKDSFEDRFNVFKLKVANKYGVPPEVILLIHSLKATVQDHKKSPVEFVKKDKFVICTEGYGKMDILSAKDAQSCLNKAKLFVYFVENALGIKK